MNCNTSQSPILCSPTGSGALLSVSDLENYLATSNVIVSTNGSGGSQVADIDVMSALAWSAGTILTLDADHSINVTAPIAVDGSGPSAGLSLITNDGGTGGLLTFVLGSGSATFADTSSSLSINGETYTIANSISALVKAINDNPAGNFALGTSVDAGQKTYRQGPIVELGGGTYAKFQGLGNTISNLKIDQRGRVNPYADVGLIQLVGGYALIENLQLANVSVVAHDVYGAYVGGLAGEAYGTLYNDTVSGAVTYDVKNGFAYVGGLVGVNGGTITSATSSAEIRAPGDTAGGGLVGATYGIVSYSSASGAVFAADAGGLAGQAGSPTGQILNSTASGNVAVAHPPNSGGCCNAGGLVGAVAGGQSIVSTSSASGNVTNNVSGSVGGLLGSVTSPRDGVVTVELSFATGAVSSNKAGTYIGGLIGGEELYPSAVQNSYARGTVTCTLCTGRKGTAGAGGLIGVYQRGTLSASYATGLVTNGGPGKHCSRGCSAGVAGNQRHGKYKSVYWDTETTGQQFCTGEGDVPGCTGETTSELKSKLQKGFDPKIWALNPNINDGYPYLIDNAPE
jgi:hypothetical protein